MVFGDEISGLDITNRRIYIENSNGQLYCDVLQNGVKAFLAQKSDTIENDFSTGSDAMASVQYHEEKTGEFEV